MGWRRKFGEAELFELLKLAAPLEAEELVRFLKGLPAPVRRTVLEAWVWQAHGGQVEPPDAAHGGSDWRVWLLMAGRGFGKTRAGAEWVWARVRETPEARIALVGANIDDVVKVMIEGESGLMRSAGTGEWARWVPSRMRVDLPNGAIAYAYSGERPEKLRGPEHHFAWCDETAKWARPEATWDNLQMTMRLGERPRLVVTTTPRGGRGAGALLKRIREDEATMERGGRTGENIHLPDEFVAAMERLYGGTRIGRQELLGELMEDVEGALWTRELLDQCRAPSTTAFDGGPPPRAGEDWKRVVVGVDPPASVEGICGIVVCGVDREGVGWVLDDLSAGGLSPDGWAKKVASAAEAWGAHRVVAEANNGGRMVESVLRGASSHLPVKLVHASEGKAARAEPVAALFERGAARIAGAFPQLENQLCGLTVAGGWCGAGKSPDRADAMVWALTELMLTKQMVEPRILSL